MIKKFLSTEHWSDMKHDRVFSVKREEIDPDGVWITRSQLAQKFEKCDVFGEHTILQLVLLDEVFGRETT